MNDQPGVQRWVALAVGAAAGVIVVLGVGLMLPAAGQPAPPPPVRAHGGGSDPAHAATAPGASLAGADCAGRMQAATRALAQIAGDRDLLEFQHKLLEGQLAQIGGLPIPWTDELDPALTEAALLPQIQAVEAASEVAEVLEVDCSEFPCLIWLETTGPSTQSAGVSGEDGLAFANALEVRSGITSGKVGPEGARRAFSVIAARGPVVDPDVQVRIDVRMDRARKALRQRLQAEAGEAP